MNIDLATALLNTCVAQFICAPITRERLADYAQASGDLNPLHLDPSFAKTAGFDDVVVHGMYGMAQLGRLLTEHFPAENIRSFSVRFNAVIPVDHYLHCRAQLIERSATAATLALEALIQGPGPAAGTTAITGAATIALSYRN